MSEKKSAKVIQVEQLTVVLQKYMALHKKQALSKEKLEKAKVIRNTITSLREGVAALDIELEAINSEIKAAKTSDVIVKKQIFPGVLITVNGIELPIRKETKGGRFIRDGDGLRWISV